MNKPVITSAIAHCQACAGSPICYGGAGCARGLPAVAAVAVAEAPESTADRMQEPRERAARAFPPPRPSRRAPELLEAGAATYRERNATYGDNYRHFGAMMEAMFPNGLTINSAAGFNRLGIFIHCATKLSRYAQGLASGGHIDSAHDLMVYAAMLEEMTDA